MNKFVVGIKRVETLWLDSFFPSTHKKIHAKNSRSTGSNSQWTVDLLFLARRNARTHVPRARDKAVQGICNHSDMSPQKQFEYRTLAARPHRVINHCPWVYGNGLGTLRTPFSHNYMSVLRGDCKVNKISVSTKILRGWLCEICQVYH